MRNSVLCSRLSIISAAFTFLIFSQVQSAEKQCDITKYQSVDGSCNNLQHPEWGTANRPYLELLPPANDEFLKSLPSIDAVTKEILANVKNVSIEYDLYRTGVFQMWTDMLLLDLDLPSKGDRLKNEATPYLDASFLYGLVNFTLKADNGTLVYHTHPNSVNTSSYAKAAVHLLINEHNRMASIIKHRNESWGPETIFEKSKRAVIAGIQQITYTQYLPLLVGEPPLKPNRTEESNFRTNYDKDTEAGIYKSASQVVFELLRRNNIEDDDDEEGDDESLAELLRFYYLIKPAPSIQDVMSKDTVTSILKTSRNYKLASYKKWRDFCINNAETKAFYNQRSRDNEIAPVLTNQTSDDLDLLTGGLLEPNVPNGLLGPTFACIVSLQFENIKRGDRFWYSNGNTEPLIKDEFLKKVRKITVSDLICSNTDILKAIQKNAFLDYDSKTNPSLLCSLKTKFQGIEEKRVQKRRSINDTKNATSTNANASATDVFITTVFTSADASLNQRRQEEYTLYTINGGGADPKSTVGTAAAFSKPTTKALLLANNSILLEYVGHEILELLQNSGVSDELINELDGYFLQEIDVNSYIPKMAAKNTSDNCPAEDYKCDPTYPYRSFTGYCNNLLKPDYGKSLTTFARKLLPAYEGDGISSPRITSVKGSPLPSPRLVSTTVHPDESHLSKKHSMMLMQFAQLLDHDITMTPVQKGFATSIPDCRSCDSPKTVHPECFPFQVPPNDPFYPPKNTTTGKPFCLPFMRSLPGQQILGSREQVNQNSAFIDASMIYGENNCGAATLRTFRKGRLNSTISPFGDKDLLPQYDKHPECRAPSGYCLVAGDGRASEQAGLTSLHTIFMREHNRVADSLKDLNPKWDDERLYQTARKIVTAEFQHIVYNEFLPRILGDNKMTEYGLTLEWPNTYFKRYSKSCNPGVVTEFAAAAFRIGHTLLRPFIPRMSPENKPLEQVQLRDTFFNPDIFFQRHMVDEMIRGLYSTEVETLDQFITKEITEHLFEEKKVPKSGIDLIALNVQRARDHGITSYNEYRVECGLKRAKKWSDFAKEMPDIQVERLKSIYASVNDVDLFPGGLSERPVRGGLVGPTFACIIGQQFHQAKFCDRFWYETDNPILKFTREQLAAIREATMSRILCDNMDIPTPIQRYAMDMPSDENIKMKCSELAQVNLKAWKD